LGLKGSKPIKSILEPGESRPENRGRGHGLTKRIRAAVKAVADNLVVVVIADDGNIVRVKDDAWVE
jgi:DNA/RNA endonuclease YhcR with UshA esterase domain